MQNPTVKQTMSESAKPNVLAVSNKSFTVKYSSLGFGRGGVAF